jgi:hypothetical protein
LQINGIAVDDGLIKGGMYDELVRMSEEREVISIRLIHGIFKIRRYSHNPNDYSNFHDGDGNPSNLMDYFRLV